ncbi:cytochrome c oxidase subunit II [Thermoflavimicrobium dichotomicum]|uniref:Cytochrome c oxidase subunit 2 n=1 Tax=Thermoflavimicrobium dichotomicum TaxID=46223 RepID=A0A1I3JDR4_9BACL|nr:cytochrome c oxidase subunit 2 [Thermoflavimicrobium dichotomicum]
MVSRQHLSRVLSVFALVAFLLAGCGDPRLNALQPKGTAGEQQLDLIMLSIYIMLFVFAVVMAIFIYVIVRFRKRKGVSRTPKQVHGSTLAEIVWTAIPIILLAILAVPTVKTTFNLGSAQPKSADALKIKVTGYQYWWEFEYLNANGKRFKTAQELHIPVGKKVYLEIYGKDVLHSFWVPALGGKMDVIPGKVNTMWLDAKKPGEYQGKCAELCGAGHALMDFKVYAHEQADFDKWVAQMTTPHKPTTVAEKEGEKIFKQNCLSCHATADPKIKGPDLSKFGTRHTIAGFLPKNEKNLEKWLKDPESVKPGARMPKINYLNDQEMKSLMEYLMNSK